MCHHNLRYLKTPRFFCLYFSSFCYNLILLANGWSNLTNCKNTGSNISFSKNTEDECAFNSNLLIVQRANNSYQCEHNINYQELFPPMLTLTHQLQCDSCHKVMHNNLSHWHTMPFNSHQVPTLVSLTMKRFQIPQVAVL